MGRFINADAFASTGQGILGNNMFAYCLNNPVRKTDPTGEFGLEWILYIFNPYVLYIVCAAVIAYCSSMLLLTLFDMIAQELQYYSFKISIDDESEAEQALDQLEEELTYSPPNPFDDDDDDYNDDYYDDDNNFGRRQKIGKSKGKTPGSNQAQNKQFKDATKDLDKAAKRTIHEEISGEGLGYHDIVNLVKYMWFFVVELFDEND